MNNKTNPSLEERKRHGSILFPFNIYPCTIPLDFPSVALHWHRSMELIYVKKGTGRIRLGEGNHIAAAGDIFIVPPDTLHGIRSIPGVSMEYENIIFDTELLGSSAADICAQQYLIPLSAGQLLHPMQLTPKDPSYERIVQLVSWVEQLSEERRTGFELGIKGTMLQMLCYLVQLAPQPPAPESPNTAQLRTVVQYVQEHYAQSITVATAAALCGFSTSHFMRWFRQMSGSSFGNYLKECRLAAAAERLRTTGDKILTVAGDCGFESLANFNRHFHARYGMTPSEYRKS